MKIMKNGAEINIDKDTIQGIDIVQEGLTFRVRVTSKQSDILTGEQFLLSDLFPSRDDARNFVEAQGELVDYNVNKDVNKAVADTGARTLRTL